MVSPLPEVCEVSLDVQVQDGGGSGGAQRGPILAQQVLELLTDLPDRQKGRREGGVTICLQHYRCKFLSYAFPFCEQQFKQVHIATSERESLDSYIILLVYQTLTKPNSFLLPDTTSDLLVAKLVENFQFNQRISCTLIDSSPRPCCSQHWNQSEFTDTYRPADKPKPQT